MAEGVKINALDPLSLPIRTTDNKIIGRGTQSFRTPVLTPDPLPILAAVVDSGPPSLRGMISWDPINFWEQVHLPVFANNSGSSWADLIYVDAYKELWAVAALNGGDNKNTIAVSKDGRNWSGRSSDETSVNNGIAYSPSLDLFVVCRGGGITTSDRIFTSNDHGRTWTTRTLSVASVDLRCVAWSPTLSLFCAMGVSNAVWTSPDGTNWTQRTGPTSGGTWRKILWAGGTHNRFYATDTNNLARSSDGTSWAMSAMGIGGNGKGLSFSEPLNTIVCSDASANNLIVHSTNGTSFTPHTVSGNWYDTCYSAELGLFIAYGLRRIATSPDGATWTIQPNSTPNSLGPIRVVATR